MHSPVRFVHEPVSSVTCAVLARAPLRPLRVVLLAAVLVASCGVVSLADAQFGPDQSCPPGAICHPMGAGLEFMSGMTEAADAVGQVFNQRRRESDCSGLGVDGCLGLLLHKLMCVVDGRDWVQDLCAADGGGDGEGDAETQANARDGQPVFARRSGLPEALRDSLLKHRGDRPLHTIRDGKGNGFDFFLHGVFAFDESDSDEYFALLRAVDVRSGSRTGVVLGAVGDYLYAGTIDAFKARR